MGGGWGEIRGVYNFCYPPPLKVYTNIPIIMPLVKVGEIHIFKNTLFMHKNDQTQKLVGVIIICSAVDSPYEYQQRY